MTKVDICAATTGTNVRVPPDGRLRRGQSTCLASNAAPDPVSIALGLRDHLSPL